MFWNRAPRKGSLSAKGERRPLSIATRMSLWYALSAFAVVVAATAFLYGVLATNLERQEARFSVDELTNVRLLLDAAPSPGAEDSARLDEDRELYVRVINPSGAISRETPGMAKVVPPPSANALKAIRNSGGVRQDVRSARGEFFQTLTAPAATDGSGAQGYVQIAVNRGDEERLLSLYRRRMALVLGLTLIATVLAGYLIARAGTQPIERISETAARIGSTTLNERIATPGLPAELAGLAVTFNTMLDRLEESFARVSRFSDDVAHELRTPVNNLRGEIEVALGQPRSDEAYREVLGSCLEECARLSRIIQSLLFLARADEVGAALARETTDVGQALSGVREFYEAAAAEAGVGLVLRVSDGLEAALDRTLFQQAVGNLISNALAHTPAGGHVTLEAALENRALVVRVSDTGCGIGGEHLHHVFDRFYRVDRARTGSLQNVGLGLAVVRSIAERHGGSANIVSEPGRGVEVTLTFAPAS